MVVVIALSGSHGEWTNSDDVAVSSSDYLRSIKADKRTLEPCGDGVFMFHSDELCPGCDEEAVLESFSDNEGKIEQFLLCQRCSSGASFFFAECGTARQRMESFFAASLMPSETREMVDTAMSKILYASTQVDELLICTKVYRDHLESMRLDTLGYGRFLTVRAKYTGLGGKSKVKRNPQADPAVAAHAREVAQRLDDVEHKAEEQAGPPQQQVPEHRGIQIVVQRPGEAGENAAAGVAAANDGEEAEEKADEEVELDVQFEMDALDMTREEVDANRAILRRETRACYELEERLAAGEDVDADEFEVDEGDNKDKYDDFLYAAHPEVETLHAFRLPRLRGDKYVLEAGVGFYDRDCFGSPFCGLTCIDVAVGANVNPESYDDLCGGNPRIAGRIEFLKEYAAFRGVNLVVHRRNPDNTFMQRPLSEHMSSTGFKTVHLVHSGPVRGGHYTLVCQAVSSGLYDVVMPNLPQVEGVWMGWLYASALVVLVGFLMAQVHYATGLLLVFLLVRVDRGFVERPGARFARDKDMDVRNANHQKEKLTHQDLYTVVDSCTLVRVAHVGFSFVYKTTEQYTISMRRFLVAWYDAQADAACGRDPARAAESVAMLRGINTDLSIDNVIGNTIKLVRDAGRLLPLGKAQPNPGKVIAYSAPGCESMVADLDRIEVNQIIGMGGGPANCVEVYNVGVPEPQKPVAVCPLPIYTQQGLMTCGLIPRTEPYSLVVAYAGRSMTHIPRRNADVKTFLQFAVGFVDMLVDNLVIPSMAEPDCVEYFALHNKGKKSQKYIAQVVQEYNTWRMTGHAPKTFTRHKAFVKSEDSSKETKASVESKPRLIMVMSNKMLVECSPILKLFDCWNHGPMSKFQVKDISPSEMIQKIEEISSGPHCTTDYSSWESSLDPMIRHLENRAMLKLCNKAGFTRTRMAIRDHVLNRMKPRTLWSRNGKFSIRTRCSGDYWTSFGNGVINLCLMAYCFKLKHPEATYDDIYHDLHAVAEGDDGLVDSSVPDEAKLFAMGFRYSQNISGVLPGDCDFLCSRWMNGKRYLNIGKALGAVWVKKAVKLSHARQMFLLRAAANSLYYNSPGHPVLTALVNRIWRDTEEFKTQKKTKTLRRHLNMFRGEQQYEESSVKIAVVDETMRAAIAAGATGFPPIPVGVQLELEKRISSDEVIHIGRMLDEYSEIRRRVGSNRCLRDEKPVLSEQVAALLDVLSVGRQ